MLWVCWLGWCVFILCWAVFTFRQILATVTTHVVNMWLFFWSKCRVSFHWMICIDCMYHYVSYIHRFTQLLARTGECLCVCVFACMVAELSQQIRVSRHQEFFRSARKQLGIWFHGCTQNIQMYPCLYNCIHVYIRIHITRYLNAISMPFLWG